MESRWPGHRLWFSQSSRAEVNGAFVCRYRDWSLGRYVGVLLTEQANGEVDIDSLTDVYALGALLYELLSGSPRSPVKSY